MLRTVAVVAVAALVAGVALGQPLLLAYVETGSMAPTIDAGDGFVVVPAALAPAPEPGDVVVFEAETIQGGGPTTHRVVAETDAGYETRGDANPFTDQDGGEPYVTDDRVLARAVTVGGSVLVVPGLGTAISALHGVVAAVTGLGPGTVAGVLVAIGAALVVVGSVLEGPRRERDTERSRWRPGVYRTARLVHAVALVFVCVVVVGTLFASGSMTYALLADGGSAATDRELVVEPGGTTHLEQEVENAGLVPVVAVHDPGPGVTVERRAQLLAPRTTTTATVAIAAPDEPGAFERRSHERHYLAVVPPSLLLALHDVHPWLATAATAGVLGGAVVLAGRLRLPRRYLRVRWSSRPGS